MSKKLSILLLSAAFLISFCTSAQSWVNGGNALSANGTIGTTTNFAFIFKTNNSDRGRITNGGNWGIGTASPVGKFHVNGNGSFGNRVTALNATRALNLVADNAVMRVVRIHAADAPAVELISRTTPDGPNVAYWDFYAEPSDKSFRIRDRVGAGLGLNRLTVTSPNGYVGIGTTTPRNELHVIGLGRFSKGLWVESGSIHSDNLTGNGIEGFGSQSNGIGVAGGGYFGVHGAGAAYGIYGHSINGSGVYGYSENNPAGNFESNNHWGMRASTQKGTYAGVFYGRVWTSMAYDVSDKNLKQNIRELGSAMDIITKLKPRYYEFKTDEKYRFLNLPKGEHYGLLAQDVEAVLPNLVSTADHEVLTVQSQKADLKPYSNGSPIPQISTNQKRETISIKAVNYTELIPIMVKALQEENAANNELKNEVEDLKKELAELKELVQNLTHTRDMSTSPAIGMLHQNLPNPVKTTTVIRYSLPAGLNNGQLVLTDVLGRTIKILHLSTSGVLNLDVSTLSSGVYNYSLVVDGKTLQTKKLKVTR